MSLTGWNADKKIKLTIPAQSSALTNFPVLVKLSGTSGTGNFDCAAVFTELGANSKKIAVEVGDSGNQCYVEIERWDNANSLAWLWVKVPSISATAATVLYFYYDSAHVDNTTYVGDIGSTPGQNVWDSNFIFVCHQAQDPSGTAPQIKDSTSNAKHGTSYGSMTSGDLVDGLVGKALDYDGTDDYTQHGTSTALNGMTAITLEVCCDLSAWLAYGGIVGKNQGGPSYEGYLLDQGASNGDFRFFVGHDGTGASTTVVFNDTTLAQHYFTCTANATQAVIWDGDTKGTPVSTGSNHSLNGGTANLTIGEQSFLTGYYATGWIDEIRISDIVRSDDWITATNLSNTDALIAFSPLLTTVISILEQTYDLEIVMVLKVMEQTYSLTPIVRQRLEQIYGLKMLVLLSQPYGDAPAVLKQLLQYYGSAAKVTQVLIQLYDDMHMIRTSLEQPYSYPAFLRKVMEQRYSIAGTQLLVMSNQLYSVKGTDLVRQQLLQPFSIASGEAQRITYTSSVVVSGASGDFDLNFYHINIEASRDQYCMSCEVHLAGQADYMRCRVLDDLTITVDGEVFEFFVESKQRNRGHGTAEYTVKGLSKTGLLDAPYADPITDDLSGMASQIVAGLASGYTVNWTTVDWHIPANILMPADQTPLEIIRDIAAAAGAILQTEPDGSLTVEPAYPVPVNQWPTTAIAHHLSDALDFFTTGENYDHRAGYNRYLVSDQLTSEDTLRLEEEAITSATKYIRAYQTPWVDDFTLRHTGGSWVSLEPLEIEQPFIEDEIVEFVGSTGSTAYPIYARVAVEWLATNLGTVAFAEDGTLQSSVAGESLLRISYRTKCRKYLATDHEDEQVQLVAEGAE